MLESNLTPSIGSTLPVEDRLRLVQTLNALPSAQFEEILFALKPPSSNLPGNSAPRNQRSLALLEWAESPLGHGLRVVENLLDRVVFKDTKTTENYHVFVISGRINKFTIPTVEAIAKLLKQKTEDDSIDVVFYEEGSIRIVINGSKDGIDAIKNLFDWNELGDIEPQVEYIREVRGNTSSFRKARLIHVLKLRDRSLSLSRSRTLSSANDLVSDLASNLSDAVHISNQLASAVVSIQARAVAVDSNNRGARELIPEIVFTRFSDRAARIGEGLDRSNEQASGLASYFSRSDVARINNPQSLQLTRESMTVVRNIQAEINQVVRANRELPFDSLASISDSSNERSPFFRTAVAYLASVSFLLRLYPPAFLLSFLSVLGTGAYLLYDTKFGNNVNTAKKLSNKLSELLAKPQFTIRDLENQLGRELNPSDDLDLTNVDLRGANLSNIYFDSTQLEGADFANANVFGACFRNDSRISRADRADLEARGAIFINLAVS